MNLHLPHTAKPPHIGKFSSVESDTQWAGVCCGTLYDISKSVQYFTQVEAKAIYASQQILQVIELEILKLHLNQVRMIGLTKLWSN